jgi:hypothetical protein
VKSRADSVRRKTRWNCVCDCGALSNVSSGNLVTGKVASCGCSKSNGNPTHGHNRRGRRSTEYVIWASMLDRCRRPAAQKWADYGGRGIGVCERWNSFENFLADMGPRPSAQHSIDRRNNDGNYEPGNCRWATRAEQMRNRRNNVRITYGGTTMTATEWAQRLGLGRANVITKRLARGWTAEEALALPRGTRKAS